jgi:hypothetical protein
MANAALLLSKCKYAYVASELFALQYREIWMNGSMKAFGP